MAQVFISIPQEAKQELQRIAEESYSTMSQVARECLLRGLEQRRQADT